MTISTGKNVAKYVCDFLILYSMIFYVRNCAEVINFTFGYAGTIFINVHTFCWLLVVTYTWSCPTQKIVNVVTDFVAR
jgi:hypothetical protein